MRWLRALSAASALTCALLCSSVSAAEPGAGPGWAALTPAQQQTLAPLRPDWASIDANRKLKWLEMAGKFPSLPAEERQRIQTRMADWARMTPAERARARLQFQEAQLVPSGERQERWKAYQALTPDERQTLAQRAKPAAAASAAASATTIPGVGRIVSTAADSAAVRAKADDAASTGATAASGASGKRNLVTPLAPVPSRVVTPATTPMVVQARPGATTTNMTLRSAPPSHNQAGLPKIAATPGYVDRNTLLPRRGPQGAAVRAASADPAEQP